tara:strand:- start:31 stop:687 length:657 start_codon:yes stop_codon:yes gene_type:complete
MKVFHENKKENFKLYQLFSIPLMSFNYGDISHYEFDIFDRYLKKAIENKFNYVTNENYFLDKELPSLRKFIENSIDTYVSEVVGLDKSQNIKFQITQSWINISPPGCYGHHEHSHPNSFISGVFYIKVNDNDNIIFKNEFVSKRDIRVESQNYNIFNTGQLFYPVKKAELILFPSNLVHQVDPIDGGSDRISLSFNVFPFGSIGSQEELCQLHVSNDK